MQTFIEFFFGNLENIIMGLALIALGISGFYLIYKVFFFKDAGYSLPSEQIEEALKKVLAQVENLGAGRIIDGAQTSDKKGLDSSSEPQNDQKWDQLQAELKTKQKEIEKLTTEIKGREKNENASADLLNKIKELEARLAEYEIIEDDIADLSKYKEENAKLKKQVEKLKAGQPSDDSELSEEATVDLPEEKTLENKLDSKASIVSDEQIMDVNSSSAEKEDVITEDLINEFEQAVNEQLGKESGSAKKLSSDIEIGEEIEVVDSNLNFDETELPTIVDTQAEVDSLFEKAEAEMQSQMNTSPIENKMEKENSPKKVDSSKASLAKETKKDDASDDIFGEFINEAESTSVLDEALNPDKMLEEISSLSDSDGVDVSQLDEEFDVERMATEAQTLDKNTR